MPGIRIEDRLPVPRGIGTEDYFSWLVTIVSPRNRAFSPEVLMALDQQSYFVDEASPSAPLDVNWVQHVEWLRNIYVVMGGPPEDRFACMPTVFEWLVCMAVMLEDQVMHDPYRYPEDRSWCWFWAMMHNTGFDSAESPEVLALMVSNLLNRNFSPSGAGSICGHCQGFHTDMRCMDWWGQMQYWCGQNFDWSPERAFG